jgi:hypothetical protein
MPYIMTQSSPPTAFPIHYSLIILQYGAVYAEILITRQINNEIEFVEHNPSGEANKYYLR